MSSAYREDEVGEAEVEVGCGFFAVRCCEINFKVRDAVCQDMVKDQYVISIAPVADVCYQVAIQCNIILLVIFRALCPFPNLSSGHAVSKGGRLSNIRCKFMLNSPYSLT
jgi:hypothetical protein